MSHIWYTSGSDVGTNVIKIPCISNFLVLPAFQYSFSPFQATSKSKYLFWTCKIHLILICLQNLSKPDYIILQQISCRRWRRDGCKIGSFMNYVFIIFVTRLKTYSFQFIYVLQSDSPFKRFNNTTRLSVFENQIFKRTF